VVIRLQSIFNQTLAFGLGGHGEVQTMMPCRSTWRGVASHDLLRHAGRPDEGA
jgi:hypothetical protein